MKLIRRNSFNHPPPPAACQCVWIFLGFIFGYIFCLISSPSLDQPSETTINDPISIKKPKLDIPAWSGDVRSLVFRAMAPTPINHPGSIGEVKYICMSSAQSTYSCHLPYINIYFSNFAKVSKVLKQRLITGRDTGMKSLVHLSMVDFGDGGVHFVKHCETYNIKSNHFQYNQEDMVVLKY